MYLVGEGLIGEGDEVAHIDLIIGEKEGPVGVAFANAFSIQSEGHTPLLAVITPNLLVKPVTILVPKVDIKNMQQAALVFGTGQAAVAKAVADCVSEGIISEGICEDICIVCGIFIHPKAKDAKKIYDNNYEATQVAVKRAVSKEPGVKEVLQKKDSVVHPLRGF